MGFLLSFNHSKYINYIYVLINKPLNHFTKIISLVMSELNLSNLVKALCLRNHKHGLGEDSLQFVSTNRRAMGAGLDGKEVTRHWVDINPAAVEVLKRTSWHIETTSSTIRFHPVTKDDSVCQ